MADTLLCKIYENEVARSSPSWGTDAYYLQVETVVHMFLRLPTQAGLPGDYTTKDPQTLTIDVGVCTETISITGVVNNVSTVTGDPTKIQLEDVAKKWWDYGADKDELAILEIDSSRYYSGNIKSATFTREGGLEDRWTFEIIFVVNNYQG